jgi:serine/threonine protein kinase
VDSSEAITLGKVLGEGASAVTFKAQDVRGRTVCVKQYKTSVQVADKNRIQREIEVLKKLNHPQVPSVFGSYIDTVNGRDLLHVVQEFVDGEDLASWSKSTRFEQSTVLEILIDTLEVLAYLHTAQPPILHRDIKPSNLMRRLDGRIVLIDFGQAVQDVHRTLGQTMVTGTIGYQAPEQIVGEATPKSDVYSVGVIAVELLTGTPAYTMLQGQTLRWEKHCRRLPLSVQEWLDAVLHPDGSERYTSQQACAHLKQLVDAFVSTADVGTVHTVPSLISSNFLELLDDAIHDESESKRKQREVEHRKRINQERENEHRQQQEQHWTESENQLWLEMWSSWERLLDTIESGKVSREKGLEIFNHAFRERVEECERLRNWGSMHSDVVILCTNKLSAMD